MRKSSLLICVVAMLLLVPVYPASAWSTPWDLGELWQDIRVLLAPGPMSVAKEGLCVDPDGIPCAGGQNDSGFAIDPNGAPQTDPNSSEERHGGG